MTVSEEKAASDRRTTAALAGGAQSTVFMGKESISARYPA
jgi:hypothetical protein